MSFHHFETLIETARQRLESQRLLFVFLHANKTSGREQSRTTTRQGEPLNKRTLQTVTTMDKTLDELTTFEALVNEVGAAQRAWEMVLIGFLPGLDGRMPTHEDAELPLNVMVKTVQNGGDLSRFEAFDHQGNPITI